MTPGCLDWHVPFMIQQYSICTGTLYAVQTTEDMPSCDVHASKTIQDAVHLLGGGGLRDPTQPDRVRSASQESAAVRHPIAKFPAEFLESWRHVRTPHPTRRVSLSAAWELC